MKERLYDTIKWLVVIVALTLAIHSIIRHFNEGQQRYTLSIVGEKDSAVIVRCDTKTGDTAWARIFTLQTQTVSWRLVR